MDVLMEADASVRVLGLNQSLSLSHWRQSLSLSHWRPEPEPEPVAVWRHPESGWQPQAQCR
jgi:hypothetical protein